MKVYVLESDEWGEERELHGVFSTFEKAGKANEILDIAGIITEVDLDRVTYINVSESGEKQVRTVKV